MNDTVWAVQELNQKVEEALACPCLDDLKEGPCGQSFVAAFSCFLKSQASEKVCNQTYVQARHLIGMQASACKSLFSLDPNLHHCITSPMQVCSLTTCGTTANIPSRKPCPHIFGIWSCLVKANVQPQRFKAFVFYLWG